MKRFLSGFLVVINFVVVFAQQDSIYIEAKVSNDKKQITVYQEITYINKSDSALSVIKLLNWVAAYQNRNTPLVKRNLEDRKNDLYFAQSTERGGLANLKVTIQDQTVTDLDSQKENIFIPLLKTLEKGEKITFTLEYHLNLPNQKFTGYGTDGNKISLKYFFLVPDSFDHQNSQEKKFIDIEENQSPGNYWKILLDVPVNHYSQSNLPQIQPNYFEGNLNTNPEFLISANNLVVSLFSISIINIFLVSFC